MATVDATETFDLPLCQARRLLPGRPSLQTVFRWTKKGVRGCVLESQPSGHRVYTSEAAIARFLSALSAARQQPISAPTVKHRSARQAVKDARRADEILAAFGIAAPQTDCA